MSNNTWAFSGSIAKWQAKQSQADGKPASWGKMWLLVELDPIQYSGNLISPNKAFINVPLTYGNDKKSQQCQNLITSLDLNNFVFVKNAKIGQIKRWKKVDDGFQEYFETGVTVYPNQIVTSPTRLTTMNLGLIEGKVAKQQENTIIVSEPYMVPGKEGKKAEWKEREVPLVLPPDQDTVNIVGKGIFATASLSGIGPRGNDAICGYVTNYLTF